MGRSERGVTDGTYQPGRLRLARELREWSQVDLARGLDVTPAAISQFESGLTQPSTTTVSRMSEALGVPAEFFMLPVTETHDGFFRSLRRTPASQRRRARAIAHIAHDVITAAPPGQLPPVSIPIIPVTDLQAPRSTMEDVASRVRTALNIPPGPVHDVVRTVEDHGVVVIRLPLDSADVDAFSLPFHDRPIIVLGTDKNDRARSRFDAAHELGHLVAHGEQVWGVKEVEQQAQHFAAAFLMPANDIAAELPDSADWPAFFALKKKWQVSLGALLMRARTLRRISENQYLGAVKAASARGWRRLEPVPLGRPEQPTQLSHLLATATCQLATMALPCDVLKALQSATEA